MITLRLDSSLVIENVRKQLPQYHTRAMRKAMFEKFGRISPAVKPAALRFFYRELTGDEACAATTEQEAVDKRIAQLVEMEDPHILQDLRALNKGKSSKYDAFWEKCEQFINEDVGLAVDERRHVQVSHLAWAISLRDLIEQVQLRCDPGVAIPCQEWVRLQFWPKTPAA